MDDRIQKALDRVEPQVLAVAVVDLEHLAANYAKIHGRLRENTRIAAVVKADSYGFGAVPIVRRLYAEGCRLFFVATINEGIEIRRVLRPEAKIFVLSGLLEHTEDILVEHCLTPVLNGPRQAELWINHGGRIGKKLDAVVHVDTGMFRNGFSESEVLVYWEKISSNLKTNFVMSHLACADVQNHEMNDRQLVKFRNILKMLGNPPASLSATYGFFLGEDYHFDIIRPGKTLYGIAIRDDKIGDMENVIEVFARIVQVNSLSAGDSVGYGATFVAKKNMRTATVGVGYADGFMRKFSGFGHGFLGGKKIPMVGRISMDYTVLDATEVDERHLEIGAWVALTRSPDYTLERWALELGTLPYEVACRFGRRVERVYIGEA
ncbi:MAG: alanine racemase [Holosporaceae bacterium]|jgi:alanine racemase|nr:alanine racemase [Holosporaceae bacterium]